MTRNEWIAELRGLLERRGVPASEVADALEYYAEAIDDRVEQGFSEQQALKEIGSPAQACDAVAETVPVAKRAVAAATATRERKALVGVLLLVGAVFWVPLAFGLLGAAAGVYATIWAAVLVVWAGIGSLLACGLGAVPLACYSASCGALAEGLFSGSGLLALGALGVALIPLGIIASVLLSFYTVVIQRRGLCLTILGDTEAAAGAAGAWRHVVAEAQRAGMEGVSAGRRRATDGCGRFRGCGADSWCARAIAVPRVARCPNALRNPALRDRWHYAGLTKLVPVGRIRC